MHTIPTPNFVTVRNCSWKTSTDMSSDASNCYKADEEMEFYISSSVHGDTGLLSIIGRCGNEPIRPGVEFRAMLRLEFRRY